MSSNNTLLIARTLGFSALAGMRSLSPPALLSLYLARSRSASDSEATQRLSSPVVQAALVSLAAGEMIADKFPNAPDRVFAPAMVTRSLTGGGVGAVLWSLHKRPAWIGGVLGAVASIGATYLTFNIRLWLGRTLPLPHALSWSGVLEDAVLWLSGWLLLNSDEKLES